MANDLGVPPDEEHEPTLGDFFDHVLHVSPFSCNRVSEPSDARDDVESIHQQECDRLKGLAEQALSERRGIGAVLWGDAGVGKSHLLGRLAFWAGRTRNGRDTSCVGESPSRRNATYVLLHNVMASPERLPHYLLKCVIGKLSEGRTSGFDRTPLYLLVAGAVRYAMRGAERAAWDEAEHAFLELMQQNGGGAGFAVGIDVVYRVLFEFFRCVYRHQHGMSSDEDTACIAVRWLSGEEISRAAGRLLHLNRQWAGRGGYWIGDRQQIECVFLALTNLARLMGQPFIVCFDQADNLEADQISELARFFQVLLDHAENLLIVTAGG